MKEAAGCRLHTVTRFGGVRYDFLRGFHRCMPLERRDEAEELGVRKVVVWRLCGGVRGRAAWRVTSAVPGVVRKADIQFQPAPWVVPRRLVRVSVDFPPKGKVKTQSRSTGQSQLKRRLRPPRRTEQRTHLRCSVAGPRITGVLCPRERRAQSLPATFRVFTPESFGSTNSSAVLILEKVPSAPNHLFASGAARYSSRDLA